MITHGNEIKIFAGNSNRPLAEAIAKKLNTELGGAEVGRFSDGETAVHIDETVRGRDLFIIQSTSAPVNDNLMELLILIDAARRASAGRITAALAWRVTCPAPAGGGRAGADSRRPRPCCRSWSASAPAP